MFNIQKLKSKRRLLFYGGTSVLLHVVALAFFLGRTQNTPAPSQIAVEFETPKKIEAPVKKPVAKKALAKKAPAPQPLLAVRSGDPGRSPRKSMPRPAPAQSLDAILATDFQALRANMILPVALAKSKTSSTSDLSPADPDIHLTDGTIDRLVSEGRGYADTGNKRRRSGLPVGMSGGGGGSCK